MEELAALQNATARFEEIAETGDAADPMEFPDPRLGHAARVTARVYNPESGEELMCENVIYRIPSADGVDRRTVVPGVSLPVGGGAPPSEVLQTGGASSSTLPDHAYWIGRKLKRAIYGCVRAATVLRLRDPGLGTWEITPTMAAVKIIDWNAVRSMRGRHTEDPIKEVACMQYVSEDGRDPHPNVLGTWDVLADDQYMYSFMPFCTGGEMFTYVERDGRFPEPLARWWFRQIIQGLYHLQKKGVCHRDMSLENLLVDENTKCLVIDMGMCLKVPFAGDDGDIVDETAGTLRRLIKPQGQCGKPNYISPEVLLNVEPFDGFAIDLWAAGIILFIMLVGLPPFEFASDQDPRFQMITRGGLMRMLIQWKRDISEDAGDLLQKMLRRDPGDRLSLIEVMDHPWYLDENAQPPPQPGNEGWRS